MQNTKVKREKLFTSDSRKCILSREWYRCHFFFDTTVEVVASTEQKSVELSIAPFRTEATPKIRCDRASSQTLQSSRMLESPKHIIVKDSRSVHIQCPCEGSVLREPSEMGCVLSNPGFDLSDPEKEKVGILAIQLKERSVVHSVSFLLFFFPSTNHFLFFFFKMYFQGKHEIIFIGTFHT